MADTAQRVRFRILAGNYDQAKALANKVGIHPLMWVPVIDPSALLGLDGGVLIVTGTWRDRKDGHECLQLAKQRRMRILHDEG